MKEANIKIDMIQLREALENSWDTKTSYLGVFEENNVALGQCYPTSRVVQLFYPDIEIVEGEVWTGKNTEKHFWNLIVSKGIEYHLDLTWSQFPNGSTVRGWRIRDRDTLNDSDSTIARVELLDSRVKSYLLKLK